MEKENWPKASIHSYKNLKNNNFISGMVLSHPSKLQAFLSRQRHHIKQWGTALQISIFRCRPNCPCQQVNNSRMLFSITHRTPNKSKTIVHDSQATEQWRSKWSRVSPLQLHIQHQSFKARFHFLKLSIVKIFLNATVQEKKIWFSIFTSLLFNFWVALF